MTRKGKILCFAISIIMHIANFMSFLACTHVMGTFVLITLIVNCFIWWMFVVGIAIELMEGDEE